MSKKKKKGTSIVEKDFSGLMLAATIILTVIGLFMVYSGTRSLGSNTRFITQIVAAVIGIAGMTAATFFDYEQFKNLIRPIFIGCVALLVLVLIIGTEGDYGSKSWIRFAGISLQPSEFVKVGFIITFSYHLMKVQSKINKPLVVLGLLLHLAVPAVLILLQPDAGSTMVFLFIFVVMIFSAKLSYKYIITAVALGAASLPVIYNFLLSPFQQERIKAFLDPTYDPLGKGYNVLQSKIALGSGQFYGKGYLQGTQNQMSYLPMKYSDFIFSITGEELGFIGVAVVLILLFVLIFRCFSVAKRADNLFGRYICIGVGAMLLFHTFENAGMCMGLLPVTGIPLPFISYGGSAMIADFIAVGLVQSVSYHNKPRSVFDVY